MPNFPMLAPALAAAANTVGTAAGTAAVNAASTQQAPNCLNCGGVTTAGYENQLLATMQG